MYIAPGYFWHQPSDCGRCGYPESYHRKANRHHDYEAPSDQMRKERMEARIMMEKLAGRHHKV